jgi:NAD(P)-dependent dehydrogenase (short-subunit alcohol dehydrogenase family)
MLLKDKVVLITGSSDRVGKAIALALADHGTRVVVHYFTNKDKAARTAQEIKGLGGDTLVVQGNLSQRNDWQKIKDKILDTFGRIDVLVNNAAIFFKTPFFDAKIEDWDSFMNINLKSVFLGSQIIGGWMHDNGSGKIINISDVSSETIWPNYIPYCVSKAGITAITKGLAKALAPNVLVNCIAPGTVLLADNHDKNLEETLIERTPLKRIGSPQDIANTVLFLIEGSDFINGAIIRVDGGRSLT